MPNPWPNQEWERAHYESHPAWRVREYLREAYYACDQNEDGWYLPALIFVERRMSADA